MRQALILAGGAGTRLQSRLKDLPKPMVSIAGKPLLEHQVELVKANCFTEIVMFVSHGASAISDYFGHGDKWGIHIRYVEDLIPRGTAGAVLDAITSLSDRFLVLYGDTMLNVDLDRFYRNHEKRCADASLFLHPNDHPHDSDLVETDSDGRITEFYPYPHMVDRYYANLVNAALYVVEKAALEPYGDLTGKVDFGKHLFPQMLRDGAALFGYCSPEYIKDAGTPDRLDRVRADLNSGKIEQSSLARKAPAVLLDRDGTLNEEVNRVSSISGLHLIDGVAAPLRRLNRSSYRTAIITNQPVVARGDCTFAELKGIHNKLETLLGREGAYVDAIYYCPHHPDRGFEGERKDLKIVCECRKPSPGLVYKAAEDLNIDLKQSWLIGDSTTDIATAQNAGLKSVLVRTGHAGRDATYPVRADYEFFNLASAVDFILDDYPKMFAVAQEVVKDLLPGDGVIVSGLARTGKTTWASLLKTAAQNRGNNCVVVALDSWLKSKDARESGGVLGRYDVSAIEEFVARLSSARGRHDYSVPVYDRNRQEQLDVSQRLTISSEDIVIFDGVIGLLVPALTDYASRRIFVDSPEHLRKQNFWTEYRLRGFAENDIEELFKKREADETSTVMATKAQAEVIVEGCQ